MLALVAGIATPVCAMDADQESSSWFNWKTGAVVVGIGVAYAAYEWLTQPKPRAQVPAAQSSGRKPVYFAQPTPADLQREQEQDQQGQQDVEVQEQEEDIPTLEQSIARFRTFSAMDQKIELMAQVRAYVDAPSQQLEDLITQYAIVYCQRVKTSEVSTLTNKLFAVRNKQARQDAAQALQKKLGLLYY